MGAIRTLPALDRTDRRTAAASKRNRLAAIRNCRFQTELAAAPAGHRTPITRCWDQIQLGMLFVIFIGGGVPDPGQYRRWCRRHSQSIYVAGTIARRNTPANLLAYSPARGDAKHPDRACGWDWHAAGWSSSPQK